MRGMSAVALALAVGAGSTAANAELRTWDGGAGTTSWHDDANWSPDGIPASTDDVEISGSSTEVHYAGGTVTVQSIIVKSSAQLRVESGLITATSEFVVDSADLEYTGGTINGEVHLDDGDLFVGEFATAPLDVVATGTCSLGGELHPGQCVWVRGQSGSLNASLAVGGQVNNGTIRLESINAAYSCALLLGDGETFVNGPDGIVEWRDGSGGSRTISGTGARIIENHGRFEVGDGVILAPAGAATEWHQMAGQIVADGRFQFQAGTFVHSGGELVGTVWLDDAAIDIASSVVIPQTVVAVNSCDLIRLDAPEVTIWVRGQSSTLHADLNVSGVTNHGTILLESTGAAYASTLTIDTESTFSNPGDVLMGLGSGGPRAINGAGLLDNDGLIWCEAGVSATGSVATLNQHGGSILVEGTWNLASATLNCFGGVLNATGAFFIGQAVILHGGDLIGDVVADGAQIDVRSTMTGEQTLVAVNDCDLIRHDASDLTIWVRGQSGTLHASLAVGGQVNNGTIRLESINAAYSCALLLGDGETFVNGPDGIVEWRDGSGGSRTISGTGARIIENHGRFEVGDGVILAPAGAATEWHQMAGQIVADGRFQFQAGTFVHSGGELVGTVWLDDAAIDIASSVVIPQTVVAVNSCDLIRFDAPEVTIWVRGQSSTLHADLNVSGVANHGTILLESTGAAYASTLTIDAESTFTNQGDVQMGLGSGGTRAINGAGSVDNDGLIWCEAGVSATGSLATLNQHGGSILVEGTWNLASATLNCFGGVLNATGAFFIGQAVILHGGELIGDVIADGAQIDVRSTMTGTQTLVAVNECDLIRHDASDLTIWVRGQSGSLNASLAVGGHVNNGTIRLESIDAAYSCALLLSDGETFVNGPDGIVAWREGSGGNRTITGAGNWGIVNEGRIDLDEGSHLTINGDLSHAVTGVIRFAISGPSASQQSYLDINGDADIMGSARVDRVSGYVPALGEERVVMDASGELTGSFLDVASCDDVTVVIDHDDDEAIVIFGATSEIVGDLTGDGTVGLADLLILLAEWGVCPEGTLECCAGDIDGSGDVGLQDLIALLANWD